MTLELKLVLTLNTIALTSFGLAYWKFRSMSDLLVIIDNIYYGKTISLIFLLSMLYLLFIGARYLVFTKTTQKEQIQVIRDNYMQLVRSVNMIQDYTQFVGLMSESGVKALILMLIFVQIQITCYILQRRIDTLHENIVSRQIAPENEKGERLYAVVVQFVDMILPFVFICGIFTWLRKYYDFSFKNAVMHRQASDMYLRGAFFVYLELIVLLIHYAIALVVNIVICLSPAHVTPYLMCFYQGCGFVLDIFSILVYIVVFANSLSEMFYGIDITHYAELWKMLRSGQRPFRHGGSKAFFVNLLLFDLSNFLMIVRRIRKHYEMFVLNYYSVTRLDSFPVPTIEQLYGCSEEELRTDPQTYIQNAICPICMDVMDLLADPRGIRLIGCKHSYHTACIRNWLARGNPKCPVCNAEVFVDNDAGFGYAAHDDQMIDHEIPMIEPDPDLRVGQDEDADDEESSDSDTSSASVAGEISNDGQSSSEAKESDEISNSLRNEARQINAYELAITKSDDVSDFELPTNAVQLENEYDEYFVERDVLESKTDDEQQDGEYNELEISQSAPQTETIVEPPAEEPTTAAYDAQQLETAWYSIDKATFYYNLLNKTPNLPDRVEIMRMPVTVEVQKDDYTVDELCDAVERSCTRFVRELRLKQYLHDNPDVWLALDVIAKGGEVPPTGLIKRADAQ